MNEKIKSLKIPKAYSGSAHRFDDERGDLVNLLRQSQLPDGIESNHIREIFYSRSRKDVLRGLHFQSPPYSVGKFVSVVSGKVLDVILDLRKDSPTFSSVHKQILSDENPEFIYVPKGCAHGFLTLSENSTVLYLQSGERKEESEGGILWSSIDIEWPISNPILSQRDKNLPPIRDFDSPFAMENL